jgi:hypothetical protein
MEFDTLGCQKSLASLAKKNSFKASLFHALHNCDLQHGRFVDLHRKLKLFGTKQRKFK